MEELQNTIQDAQYMGAMVDPTPRPAAQMPVPKSSKALAEFQESLLASNPNVFSMEAVVQTPMGFYLFKRLCLEQNMGAMACFLEEVHVYCGFKVASGRRELAKVIVDTYLHSGSRGPADMAKAVKSGEGYASIMRSNYPSNRAAQELLRFQDERALLQVSGDPVDSIRTALRNDSTDDVPADLFDRLQAIIFEMLRQRMWHHFLKSKWFNKYVSMLYVQNLPVRREDFALFRVIGRGGFGMVNGCKRAITGKLYAMKVLNKKMIKKKQAEKVVINERNMLQLVDSPFILGLKYSFSTKDDLFLILDLCTGGDLSFHLRNEGRFKEDRSKFYAAQILLGLEHMHSKHIVYRDLKPDNILLDADGHAKVSDLGLATNVKAQLTGRCGTRGYWAPEVLVRSDDGKRMAYTKMVDYWSFGCIIYEMLAGVCPFRSSKAKSLLPEDKQQSMDLATLEMELDYDSQIFSPDARSFCQGLLTRDPRKRLGHNGAQEVKNHPWFFGLDWDKLEAFKIPPPFVPEKNINARSQGTIGSFVIPGKEIQLTSEEEALYSDWHFQTGKVFQEEVIELMEWESSQNRGNGNSHSGSGSRNESTSCCVIS